LDGFLWVDIYFSKDYVLYEIGIDGIKGRKNLEMLEMKPNLKSLNDIHREKSGNVWI
jgi:hypothetical protein